VGLDIYVGPLARYFAGDWETALQRHGRESGMKVFTYRVDGWEPAEPTAALAGVLNWRSALQLELGELVREPLDWAEDPGGEYLSEAPNHSGRSCVILIAAHEEFPRARLPLAYPPTYTETALWRQVVAHDRQPERASDALEQKVGHDVVKAASPFSHVYFPTTWLPVGLEEPVVVGGSDASPLTIGSIRRLRQQLDDLHDRISSDDPDLIDAERDEGVDLALTAAIDWIRHGAGFRGTKQFRARASFGLRVWRALAIAADERRLPMVLDW
jgi:hypothetical protein